MNAHISTRLIKWITKRIHGATPNIIEALQFMRSRLMNESFDPPERWRAGLVARRQAATGPRYEQAINAYVEKLAEIRNLGNSDNAERRTAVQKTIDAANELAGSVYWDMHKAELKVQAAPRPVSDDADRLESVSLMLKLHDDEGSETEEIKLRVSDILEILPQIPSATPDDATIQRALTQLDKNRLDAEIERCFESLRRHAEFYHETSRMQAAGLPPDGGFQTRVHLTDPGHRLKWLEYDNEVRRLRQNYRRLGNISCIAREEPANPYHRLANEFCEQPRHDDELAKIAGWHRFEVFTEDIRRLAQSGLGEVKAELHLLPEKTKS